MLGKIVRLEPCRLTSETRPPLRLHRSLDSNLGECVRLDALLCQSQRRMLVGPLLVIMEVGIDGN
jgi:hypothetical protein